MRQIFVIFYLVVTASVMSAQTGTLKGVITDKGSGEAIPLMNVYVENNTNLVSVTDFDGTYSLTLEAGTYVIVFSSVDYGTTKETITISGGETMTKNMELEGVSITMETLVVKTDKYAKPIEEVISTIDIVKPNIIENKASTDVSSALEQAPGLTIVDSEPQLRGGSGYSFGAGSRVMVLVDDLPILSGDAGRPSWGFIPIENIEQIEIIKGASSVLYGSAALNGVINIRTAYPKSEPKTVLTINTGVWDSPRRDTAKWWGDDQNAPFYTNVSGLHSRKVNERFSFVVGANVLYENNFLGPEPLDLTDTVNTTPLTLPRGAYSRRGRFNFNTRARAKNVKGLFYGLNGNMMYSRSTGPLLWYNDNEGLYRSFSGANTLTLQTTVNMDPYVSYYDLKGNTHSINTRFFYQDNNNDNNQANKNVQFYTEYRYMHKFQKIKDFTIAAGFMSNYARGSSQLYAGKDFVVRVDSTLLNEVEVDEGLEERTVNVSPDLYEGTDTSVVFPRLTLRYAQNIAFYAQLDKKLWDRVNLSFGARGEYFKIASKSEIQPVFRAGATVRVHQATYFRGSFGQGFRFPTIAERYINTTVGGIPIIPNSELDSEKSWNAELGIKQGIKTGRGRFLGFIDISGFVAQYDNYIEFIAAAWNNPDFTTPGLDLIQRLGFGFRSVNTGSARVSGLEVSFLGQGNFTDNFGMNILAGYSFNRPVTLEPDYKFASIDRNGDGVPELELDYYETSTDSTNNVLKYRYEHMVDADVELNYKRFSTGLSFRFYSFMKNVDNIFYNPAVEELGIEVREYREANETPEYVFDYRVSYKITEHAKIAFIMLNMLNREYALRPLQMSAPRSFSIQFSLTL